MYGYPWCPVYRVSNLPWYYCMSKFILPAIRSPKRTSNEQCPPPKLIQTSVMQHGFSCSYISTYAGLQTWVDFCITSLLEDRIVTEIFVSNSSLIKYSSQSRDFELISAFDKQLVSTVVCHLIPDAFTYWYCNS